MHIKTSPKPYWLLSAAILNVSICSLWAADEAFEDERVETPQLETFEVTVTDHTDQLLLPHSLPFSSPYGMDMDLVDTPRSISILSREQLDVISIRDPRDISKLSASAYTQSNFGAPANPSIRGQTADILVNGMRRGLTINGNGMPVNFNAIESATVLKGPPSVLVGASQYVGGYVDLITKKPRFTETSHTASLIVDSEGLLIGELDSNIVVSDTLAIRTSYTVENTQDYYYDNHKRKSHAAFAAITWVPSDTYQLELNGEFYYADYTENWGWNRVTQDLIDHGRYQTGVISSPQNTALDELSTYSGGEFGGTAAIPAGDIVKISPETRLLGDGDDSKGVFVTLQGIQTWTPDSDRTFKNNTFFQYRDRDTYSSYQYSEMLRDNWSLENRTDFETTLESKGGWLHRLNIGGSVRYASVTAATDYFHEPANYWDISGPSSEIGVTDEFVFFDNPFTAFTSAAVPYIGEDARGHLTLGFPVSPGGSYGTFQIDESKLPGSISIDPANLDGDTGNPTVTYTSNGETNDSDTLQLGIYAQDNIQINDRWSWLVGGRVDYVHVETEDPMYDDIIRFLETFGAAGEADKARAMGRASAAHDEFLFSFNNSFVFKPTKQSALYATFNYTESTKVGAGGGISVDQVNNEDEFVRASTLYEVGYKRSLYDDSLFLSLSAYHQERSDPILGGGSIDSEATGVELELTYQPSEHFYAMLGYSYIRARSSAPSGTGPFVAEASTYDSTYNSANLASGDFRTPGIPEHLLNALVVYRITENFGVTGSIVVTSPVPLTYDGVDGAWGGTIETAEIPTQYTLDLGAFYERDNWAVRLNVLNATDELNFGSVNPIYGNASVFVELPRRYELTLSYTF